MIVSLASRSISVAVDDPSAAFTSAGAVEIAIDSSVEPLEQRRALVELRRFHGGMAPHVIVGGIFQPGGTSLRIRVEYTSSTPRRRTCRSQLGRQKLYPGLPEELVEPILSGFSRFATLPPGVLTVDRGGWHPVESSPLIAELAAGLLGRVLSTSEPLSNAHVSEWLSALP